MLESPPLELSPLEPCKFCCSFCLSVSSDLLSDPSLLLELGWIITTFAGISEYHYIHWNFAGTITTTAL
ncbi:1921_t:CDS:1 [Gigaspora rosea]|nr:1921_t:CDS:1 [Gigaspora rosea]